MRDRVKELTCLTFKDLTVSEVTLEREKLSNAIAGLVNSSCKQHSRGKLVSIALHRKEVRE